MTGGLKKGDPGRSQINETVYALFQSKEGLMNPVFKKGSALVLRFAFGALLILASLDKIAHPLEFAMAVENYRIVGEYASYWIAVWLPYIELLTGLLLVTGFWAETAVLVNALLMDLFLVMVVQAAARGLDISCGCFRMDDPSKIGWLKITQNILFSVFGTLLLWLHRDRIAGSKRNFKHVKEQAS